MDIVPPVIAISGPTHPTLECGVDSYVEDGATAEDSCAPEVQVSTGGDDDATSPIGRHFRASRVRCGVLLPVVAIDIQPPPPSASAAVAVARCTEVTSATGGRCVLSPELKSQGAPRWLAAVVWSGDLPDRVTVSLYDRRPDLQLVRSQELAFDPAFRVDERWEAVGLLVAAMTSSAIAAAPPVPDREELVTGKVGSTTGTPPPPKSHSETQWRLGVAPGLSAGLGPSQITWGGLLQAGVGLGPHRLGPTVSLNYHRGEQRGPVQIFGAAAGTSVSLALDPLELRLQSSVVGSLVAASVKKAELTDSQSAARIGAELGMDASWLFAPTQALWFGIAGRVQWPRVELVVMDQLIDPGSVLGWRANVGLEFQL